MHPPSSPGTPIASRTPRWLAGLYKKHMARADAATRRRLAYDSADSDVAPDSGGLLHKDRRRTLRHVPTAEVLSLFAMHAEWLYVDARERRERGRRDGGEGILDRRGHHDGIGAPGIQRPARLRLACGRHALDVPALVGSAAAAPERDARRRLGPAAPCSPPPFMLLCTSP